MVIFLEVLSGPLEGKKFKAELGLVVGRREGTILLEEDVKVSGLHAKIELDNKGQMALMDQGSANGLVINDRRVKKVAMMPGVRFRVGDTLMTVIEVDVREAEQLVPPLSWQDHVEKLLEMAPAENRKIEESCQTFTPALQLEFVRGLQTDASLILGYGPRSAGQGHLDIDLREPEAPELAFRLQPSPGTALFQDLSRGKIRINEEVPAPDQPLQEGDLISLGGTAIRVHYV